MSGVEILSVTEHAIMENEWSWPMFFVFFFGLFGVCVIIGASAGLVGDSIGTGILIGTAMGLVVAILISPILTLGFSEVQVGTETHYKVIIDDSVSMNEFLDKYEILDQEGKIYTVKEKINEDK